MLVGVGFVASLAGTVAWFAQTKTGDEQIVKRENQTVVEGKLSMALTGLDSLDTSGATLKMQSTVMLDTPEVTYVLITNEDTDFSNIAVVNRLVRYKLGKMHRARGKLAEDSPKYSIGRKPNKILHVTCLECLDPELPK